MLKFIALPIIMIVLVLLVLLFASLFRSWWCGTRYDPLVWANHKDQEQFEQRAREAWKDITRDVEDQRKW